MAYLFTSESVSEGHPDKVADQISDALLDEFLRQDPNSKVACETLVTTGLTVLSGEVRTNGYVDVQSIARRVINRIGYNKAEYMFDGNSCGVISAIHEQSGDINRGVVAGETKEQGAGDQGMMFGYANSETDDYMPLSISLSHELLVDLTDIRREGKVMTYLRPDSKSQVTIEYDDNKQPVRVDTIVISTQHDEFVLGGAGKTQEQADAEMQAKIKEDVAKILIPRTVAKFPARIQALFKGDYTLHVNPTGKFVIGGPHGDTGLTGRKIIVDTYGGHGAHGGGAFSGKDSSKVDRSAAYAARHIAKNLVAAGVASEALVQVAYAIGVARPVSIFVNTYGTAKVKFTDGEIAKKVDQLFDLRPAGIISRFGLTNPIFEPTAAYGHMGRKPYKAKVTVGVNGSQTEKEVEFFTWEKLDYVDKVKAAFGL
jgi:S-adenosylmethionine synthetase